MSIRSLMPSLWQDQKDKDIFQDLQSEVDRIFRQFRHITPLTLDDSSAGVELGKHIPRINVAESEEQYEVEVELPGITQEDVDVSVLDQALIIEGHKKTETSTEEKEYRIVERSEGSFKRVIPLGFDVEDKDVEAKFKDGVLMLVVKKPAEMTKKAKKIEVKSAESA